MKTLPSVVKNLIKLNMATAIIAVLIVPLMRSQQTQLTSNQPDVAEPTDSYYTAVKGKTSAEQAQLKTSYQKIAQHQQEIKKLEGEIETYKNQVKSLELDKNNQPTLSTQNTNYPLIIKKNLPSLNSQAGSLLNQIIKSGQTHSSEHNFRVLGSSIQINNSQNSLREKLSTQNKNPQIQSRLPASGPGSVSFTPSTNLSYPHSTIQASKPKPSSAEIKLDSRALFSTQPPQKPLDSFITPNQTDYKSNELKNRTALKAQQLSKQVYRDYLYSRGVNPSPQQSDVHLSHANDIVAGLMVADEKGQINYGTKTYKKVQTAIRALRSGKDLNDAARLANLTPSVLNQLIKWGENRPGSLSELSEISQASPNVE
ncbi:hypothetical protein [Chroococcus sp. FPU101]|uniref:hypothetical protein n=1 Tax=Chroococcus sp. FPU101 TaxID=1974212 RepID=UPI001A8D09D4|nr:hypothetical protein [Chroococcus sp. FPU101]GFE69512.1 hypothetical protein CFPU101_21220 [Chroococcus sp. FPU101]